MKGGELLKVSPLFFRSKILEDLNAKKIQSNLIAEYDDSQTPSLPSSFNIRPIPRHFFEVGYAAIFC